MVITTMATISGMNHQVEFFVLINGNPRIPKMELPFFRSYRIEVPEMATFSLSQENWGLKYELNYET